MAETILTNANIVLADEVVTGTLVARDGARVRVNGERVADVESFYRRLWAQPLNQPLELSVWRNGTLETVIAHPRERAAELAGVRLGAARDPGHEREEREPDAHPAILVSTPAPPATRQTSELARAREAAGALTTLVLNQHKRCQAAGGRTGQEGARSGGYPLSARWR